MEDRISLLIIIYGNLILANVIELKLASYFMLFLALVLTGRYLFLIFKK